MTNTIERPTPSRDSVNLEVAATITERLAARGLSLATLARATGIPRESLRRKVRLGRRITMTDIARIATALDVKGSELLPNRP